MKMRIQPHAVPGLVLSLLLALASGAHAFYNPQTGRWLSRDLIGERGGLNLYGFVGNDPVRRIDNLGLDYFVIQVEGACGVRHRKLMGDDGRGGSYEIDIVPDVTGTYDPRRVCGIGKVQYIPRPGSPTNWFAGMIAMQSHVSTTSEQDATLAANASSLDGRKILYCLGVQDCRSIEKCTKEGKSLGQRAVDYLFGIVETCIDSVTGSSGHNP